MLWPQGRPVPPVAGRADQAGAGRLARLPHHHRTLQHQGAVRAALQELHQGGIDGWIDLLISRWM